MTRFTTLLDLTTTGSEATSWELVYDTEAKRLFVEERWHDVNPPDPSAENIRYSEIELGEYLARGDEGALTLERLIKRLFADQPPA